MNFSFSKPPSREELSTKKALQKVVDGLPKDLRFSREQRDRILKEDSDSRAADKAKHKMAPFRIEITFGSTRSTRHVTHAKIRVWESGKRLSGEGDVSMHFCAHPQCYKPFSAQYFSGDIVNCPHCMKTCLRENTVTALGPFRREMWEIRSLIIQLMQCLKGECDIVSLWHKRDIRILSEAQHMDEFREFEMREYERVVYPWWRIIEDTMHGQDIDKRLKEFLG